MNIKGKFGIPNLSNVSKIFLENEMLSQRWGVGEGGGSTEPPTESAPVIAMRHFSCYLIVVFDGSCLSL